MELLSGHFLVGLFLVLFTNVILSADNALVTAVAARELKGSQRLKAVFWGSLGAVMILSALAAIANYLLAVPFSKAIAGILLFWIAWKLVNTDVEDANEKIRTGTSTWEAIKIIALANVVVAPDNIVALTSVSNGNFWLVVIALVATIPLLVFGSTLLTFLLDYFPVLCYASAGLIVYIAMEMFFEDIALRGYLSSYESFEVLMAAVAIAIFMAVAWVQARRTGRSEQIKKVLLKSWRALKLGKKKSQKP